MKASTFYGWIAWVCPAALMLAAYLGVVRTNGVIGFDDTLALAGTQVPGSGSWSARPPPCVRMGVIHAPYGGMRIASMSSVTTCSPSNSIPSIVTKRSDYSSWN